MKKRLITVTVFLLIFTSLFAQEVFASSVNIYDKANILTESDKAEINSAIEAFEAEHGVDFVLVTHKNGNLNAYDYASGDFIILEIEYEFGEYFYELYTYGDAYSRIEQSEADRILDNSTVYNNIKGENFKTGILEFVKCTGLAYGGNYQEPFWQTLLVSFIVAAIIAAIICGTVVYTYKRKQKSASYPLEHYARLQINDSRDSFLGSRVTKVRINTSSGSSSGGGRSGGFRGGSRGRR